MALINCPACGNDVSERAPSCPRCGEPIAQQPGQPQRPAAQPDPGKDYMAFDFDRKNHLKKQSNDDPAEVEQAMGKWNWGAFGLTWIWGVGNGVFWTLLLLIPVFGWIATPIVAFVLGRKGNRLAWESKDKEWENLREFRRVQRFWALGAAGVWSLLLLLSVVLIIVIRVAINADVEVEVDAMELIEGYIRRRYLWFLPD